MQEDFLHFVWKHKRFDSRHLKTTTDLPISIIHLGQHNLNSGPDFFNAQLSIDGQHWAGNVEIHLNSSDWYLHGHEKDKAYDNVILHVVWEHDVEVHRQNNTPIPTLELKHYLDEHVLENYKNLFRSKKWINCEDSFSTLDSFTISSWLERLYIERLEAKTNTIEELLKTSKNDWEAVLFKLLCKNFGLNVNGQSFLSLASSFDFSIIRKIGSNVQRLEALLFGQANLLHEDIEEPYFKGLKDEYLFLKQKFQLDNSGVLPFQFFRLRPPNFPTIRISQLANLYTKQSSLFSKVIALNRKEEFYDLFAANVSQYWETHYTFSTSSKSSKKKLTKAFIDLILINTILPLKFAYQKFNGEVKDDLLFELINSIDIEKSSVVNKFLSLNDFERTAL